MRLRIPPSAGFEGLQVLLKLRGDDADDLFLGGRPHEAEQVVIPAVLGDQGDVFARRTGPGLGEVADQSAENFALTQAPANVADIKEQLHGELRIFDIGAVEETEQLLFRLAAHTACDSKQIQACV